MKPVLILFITILFSCLSLHGQSLDDIRKLEKIKKQLDNADTILKPESIKPGNLEGKALEVFQDSLSQPVTIEETPAKLSAKEDEDNKLVHYGYEVFKNANIEFKPEIYGPVDDGYPLGPGDQIIVTVWGEVELRHTLLINREGQVYIDKVGVIPLSGLTVAKAKRKLSKALSKSYSSISDGKAYLDLSVGKLRSIRVFVVGDVNGPGVFTVPALTTPFDLLFYAGGVKTSGSLRTISLVRNNKELQTLDFYAFLHRGEKYANLRLQNNDILVIPTITNQVQITGAISTPAIYELQDNESLKDLIDYAGGFLPDAYLGNIQIERYVNHSEPQLLTVDYTNSKGATPLMDGDQITVSKIDRKLENFIQISGPVFGPKRFAFYPGITIKDLFSQVDSVAGDAYLDRVHVTRVLPDRTKQIFSLNLNEFLEQNDQDFLLAPEDLIRIESKKVLFPTDSVRIFGAVTNPGTYELKKDMSLKDLIFSAGGFLENAMISEAEISRLDPFNTNPNKLSTSMFLAIDSSYAKQLRKNSDELFFLKANDDVFIRTNSDWEIQRHIRIRGEVKFPGTYSLISKTERITDIIERAGGLKPTAYLQGAKLIRISNSVGQIGIDFNTIINNPSDAQNIYVQADDQIYIPERLATVKIVGGVHFPSSVLFEKGKGLNYYIKAAGGYTELADEDNATIRLANGRPVHQKRFLFWKYLSGDITAGSTIYVPVFEERQSIDWSGAIRDAAAILSSMATVILIVDRVR